jgi:DNA mismatch repair protein MSH3
MVALIAILAHVGCYVPATSCTMGLLDGVYVRMGASDQLTNKRSTFHVEMGEASDILATVSDRSLVILDELGRGSSTKDGEALAGAVLHHLTHVVRPLVLFTTHYFQLARESFPSTGVWHLDLVDGVRHGVADVSFLYKLKPGAASHSHGYARASA